MSAAVPVVPVQDEFTLTLTQQVKAPPQRVFEAWLDPQSLCRWIGPRAWVESCEVVELEAKVGGRYRLASRTRPRPGENNCEGRGVGGVYRVIDRFTRLAFTWLRDGEDAETLVSITFAPSDAGTLVTLTHSRFSSEDARQQHQAGWEGSLPQLADLLEGRLTLHQEIKAPPAKVFAALLDPALVSQWMGPRSMVQACKVMTLEPRQGGRFKLQMDKRPDAPTGPGTLVVSGSYELIDPPQRLVYSWKWDHEEVTTRVSFDLHPSPTGTRLTLTHDGFTSPDRQQGHQRGWTDSLHQLARIFDKA